MPEVNQPSPSPHERDFNELAKRGDIRSLLNLQILELPAHVVEQVYRTVQPKINHGFSEQEAAQLLLLGYSTQQASGILAQDGFMRGSLWIKKEYGLHEISEDAIRSGYNIRKPMINHGFSEQEAAHFLLLGLSTREAAETLANDGFMNGTTMISKEYGLHELSASAIDSGYDAGKPMIRNGYSEKTVARFLLLSPEREKYYRETANDGFLVAAYLIKVKCDIENILPNDVIDSLLKFHESKDFSGFSPIVMRFVDDMWDKLKGEVPQASPHLMLEEIGGHNAEYARRLQAVMDRDDQVIRRKAKDRNIDLDKDS